jgi:hypothetical protein
MFPKFSTLITTYFQHNCNSSIENTKSTEQETRTYVNGFLLSCYHHKQGPTPMTFYWAAIITTTHYVGNCDHDFPLYAFLARYVDNHRTTLPTDCKSCESCESNLWFINEVTFVLFFHLRTCVSRVPTVINLHIFNSLAALHWKVILHATATNKALHQWLSIWWLLHGVCNWDHSNLMERDPFRHKEIAASDPSRLPQTVCRLQSPEVKASGFAYCTCTVRTRIQKKKPATHHHH